MVKGRLPRESNPLHNERAGFVSSHDTTGAEDYKRTSPLNPLPVKSIGDSNVKDVAVKAELELIKQGIADNKATNDLILEKLDSGVSTQLTGSILAKDNEGNDVPLTTEIDDEGKAVLRIIDSAPFGFDDFTNSNRVSNVASHKVKREVYSFKDVEAGTNKVLKINPPLNKVWEIKMLNFDCPSISNSTGSQSLYFRYGEGSHRSDILNITNDSTKRFTRKRGYTPGVTSVFPESYDIQKNALEGLIITKDVPLYIQYENNSNLIANSTTIIYIIVSESDEL